MSVLINVRLSLVADQVNKHNSTTNQCQQQIFCCKPFSEHEISGIIDSFKSKLSSGYDEIPMTEIKGAKSLLCKVLVPLGNSSLVSGIFFKKLKLSKILPLNKKGKERDMKNYRPISLCPVISKIDEKAMCIRLLV
uniref:Reverse transcriptase domain-containing protein n=1 Tax=Homalodisca liturata TaxID=320908 RepID=A0A1B6JP02_9HEMI